ncbi:hypothetical protein QOZ80_2AG0109830 [Eleusine coracana subsp. coracana]|nr:hypothetical protein QOZ80_2AG0109830 [Eleusine coracana subsp. coracana]
MEDEAVLLVPTGTDEKRGGGGEKGEESSAANEVKKQLYLAGPLVAWCLLQNVVQMISVMFVGHLGELALSSASVATAFAGVTGFSLMLRRHRRVPRGRVLAAGVQAVTYLANLSVLAVYVRISPACERSWTGFSREAFRGVAGFLKLAVPSAVMVCMKWWSFEIMVLLSSRLPNPKLETAVLSICLNTSSFAATVPHARLERAWQAARRAIRIVMLLAVAVGVSEGLGMVLVRNLWGYMYSNEEEVTGYIARMMPILAVAIFFDGLQFVFSGAVINLVAYYLTGIPAAFIFAFVCHLGGMGLWFGILCGLVVQMLLLFFMTTCTNWNMEALKAKERVVYSAVTVDATT